MAEMLDSLGKYYAENGISAEAFNCPHGRVGHGLCRVNSRDFVSAREAFVGSEYEKGTLPRVLFVSIDAASDHPGREPSKRTLEYMRYWEENGKSPPDGCNPNVLNKNLHWYRTHEVAHGLLSSVANEKGITPFLFKDIHRYFAHTNSAKCKDAAGGSKQGPRLVFDNCRPFIRPEIELLRPEVLVTQGDWGHKSVDGQFSLDRSIAWPERPEYKYEIIRIGDRKVLRFRLYHPRRFGPFNKQRREAYKWYFEVARGFFEAGVDGAATTA